jgi:hypothetical protein
MTTENRSIISEDGYQLFYELLIRFKGRVWNSHEKGIISNATKANHYRYAWKCKAWLEAAREPKPDA